MLGVNPFLFRKGIFLDTILKIKSLHNKLPRKEEFVAF